MSYLLILFELYYFHINQANDDGTILLHRIVTTIFLPAMVDLIADSPEGAHLREVATYLFNCFLRWLSYDIDTYGSGDKQIHLTQLSRILHEISMNANLQPPVTLFTLKGKYCKFA